MTLFPLGRASAMGVAILLLAGCGGSSQPTATIPEGPSARETAQQGKYGDLMYLSGLAGKSYILSYPDGKLIGTIAQTANGACSDSSGNVFLPGPGGISEYAHGATKPTVTLSLPDDGNGCSVDPTTGDLAVTLIGYSGVAIFKGASGNATRYQTDFPAYYCGYDNEGNLFVDGFGNSGLWLAELSAGGDMFSNLNLDQPIVYNPGQVQWDGAYITVQIGANIKKPLNTLAIDRLSISGSVAHVVSQTKFNGIKTAPQESWIYGSTVLVPLRAHQAAPNVGLWAYPKGGNAKRIIKKAAGSSAQFTGVTVSTVVHATSKQRAQPAKHFGGI
jgi:hypothetical protein